MNDLTVICELSLKILRNDFVMAVLYYTDNNNTILADLWRRQMWTDSTDGYQLVKELTRAIVTEVAPEEIPLFDDLIQEYFHNPEEPEFAKRPRDEALGSGLEQILPAVTPATAAMVSIILTYLANEVLKLSGTITSEIIKEKIKSKFLGPKDSAFTAEQFDIIRRLARKQAKAFGMDDSTAKRMAEALIGSLASLPAGKKH